MLSMWSYARLVVDITSMRMFVWMFAWAADESGSVLDSHLFFYDRYSELADYHRAHGRMARAERLSCIAEAYYRAAPDDDEPPEGAAMAMPVPRPTVNTNAVSTSRMPKQTNEDPSDFVPSPVA